MGRVRRCTGRCHNAKGTRCKCVCQSYFHGKNGQGAVNRAALNQVTEVEQKIILEEHGFKQGETAYIEQKQLPVEVAN